jgi:hypothetical protein
MSEYRSTGWAAHRDQYAVPVLFNPYTGQPRDVRDVQSDPQGILIVPPGKVEMMAAKPTHQQGLQVATPPAAPVQEPARSMSDEQDAFEKVFKLPDGITRFDGGYAPTSYSAWSAQQNCYRWEGWKARSKLCATPPAAQPAPTVQEPEAHLWKCLGRWSAYLVANGDQADCAPPLWLVDAVKQALAQPAPVQPVAILNHAHGVYAFRSVNLQGLPDGEYQLCIAPSEAHRAAPVQEPVAFLANGTRFKISYDSRQSGGQIHGITPELGGRWVAFVAAEDDCHLKLTTPPAAQRQWVGLTEDEMYLNCPNWLSQEQCKVWIQQIEAKLKEKNT